MGSRRRLALAVGMIWGIVGFQADRAAAQRTELVTPPLAVARFDDFDSFQFLADYADGTVVDPATGIANMDVVAGLAKAGAWGQFNYAFALSPRPNTVAGAHVWVFAKIRRTRPTTAPLEAIVRIKGSVKLIGCCEPFPDSSQAAGWVARLGRSFGSQPIELYFEDRGGHPVLSGWSGPAPPMINIGGQFVSLVWSEFLEMPTGSTCCVRHSREIRGQSHAFPHDLDGPDGNLRSLSVEERIQTDETGRVAIELSAGARGRGFAFVDPEITVPPDRDDLEIVFETPANPHPPGPALTQEEMDVLTAHGVDVARLISEGMLAPPTASDTTPPSTIAIATPGTNGDGWNKSDVVVALHASDNAGGSGVKEIQFSLSGAQGGAGTIAGNVASVPISAEGTTTLTYVARDNAGNGEAAKTLTVRIDKTPPTVSCAAPVPAFRFGQAGASISATVSDAGSGGVASLVSAPANTRAAGTFTANLVGADVAGNQSSEACAYTVLTPEPTSLGGNVLTKSGPQNARVWPINLANAGPGVALGTQVSTFTLTQTFGTACTPRVRTALPAPVGDSPPGGSATVNLTIDFSSCAPTSRFTARATFSANGGATTGSMTRTNQFP